MKKFFIKAGTTKATPSKMMDETTLATYKSTLNNCKPALYAYASAKFNYMMDEVNPVDKAVTNMAYSALGVIIDMIGIDIRKSEELLDTIAQATLKDKVTAKGDAMFAQSKVKTARQVLKGMRDEYGTRLNGISDDAYMTAVKNLEDAQKALADLADVEENYNHSWEMASVTALIAVCDKVFTAKANGMLAKTPAQLEAEAEARKQARKERRKANAQAKKEQAKADAEKAA